MASSMRKDWLKMLPGLLISALSVIAILYFVDLNELIEVLRNADYVYLALGFSFSLIWIFVRAFAWRSLLADLPRYSDVFFAVNEGYLLNNLLPLRLGEVGRAFLLGRKPLPENDTAVALPTVETPENTSATLGFWRTMSSVVVERVLDMAFGVTILLVSLPFVINVPWASAAAQTTSLIVAGGIAALYLMGRYPRQVLAIFERLTARIAFARRLGDSLLPRLLEGLSVFQDWKRFVRVVAWIALNWAIGLLSYWLYIRAFVPHAPVLWASFVLGVVAVGGTIPSSPGNVGVLEGATIAALSVFGVDPAIALGCGVSQHIAQIMWTTLLGGYGLSREGETLTGIYRQLRNRNN
ncbi:MAG: lysylphosphatidylglycerol synthase transmembrane domain-containing protein [Chloroflexota bacterium]